ncbi:MAG: hypothetical protein ABJN95_12705 [Maribacter sp.]|uniref:hypothetical protein n=1 Tax=Maribacter sp. TaxID=1897614 RepID=UPI00329946FA
MKKHRNFVLFYSLWLAAIMGMFVAFGEETPKEYLKTDGKVCTVSDDYLQLKTTKANTKKPCQHKEL